MGKVKLLYLGLDGRYRTSSGQVSPRRPTQLRNASDKQMHSLRQRQGVSPVFRLVEAPPVDTWAELLATQPPDAGLDYRDPWAMIEDDAIFPVSPEQPWTAEELQEETGGMYEVELMNAIDTASKEDSVLDMWGTGVLMIAGMFALVLAFIAIRSVL